MIKSSREILLLLLAGLLVGCTPVPIAGTDTLCTDKASIQEAVEALNIQRQQAESVEAHGDCKVRWVTGEGKTKREKLNVVLRFCPPDKLFFDGRVLNQEVMRLGSNSEEFWVRMKEASRYQWGTWKDARKCKSHELINPGNMLEALGMVTVDDSYTLSNDGFHDILTLTDGQGRNVKRVHVSCDDYLVRKIEYYNNGIVSVVIELDDYTKVGKSNVARSISITNLESTSMYIKIELKSIRPFANPKPKLFERPSAAGFRDVLKLNDECEFIIQQEN